MTDDEKNVDPNYGLDLNGGDNQPVCSALDQRLYRLETVLDRAVTQLERIANVLEQTS